VCFFFSQFRNDNGACAHGGGVVLQALQVLLLVALQVALQVALRVAALVF
jgi:hypothetical protein